MEAAVFLLGTTSFPGTSLLVVALPQLPPVKSLWLLQHILTSLHRFVEKAGTTSPKTLSVGFSGYVALKAMHQRILTVVDVVVVSFGSPERWCLMLMIRKSLAGLTLCVFCLEC